MQPPAACQRPACRMRVSPCPRPRRVLTGAQGSVLRADLQRAGPSRLRGGMQQPQVGGRQVEASGELLAGCPKTEGLGRLRAGGAVSRLVRHTLLGLAAHSPWHAVHPTSGACQASSPPPKPGARRRGSRTGPTAPATPASAVAATAAATTARPAIATPPPPTARRPASSPAAPARSRAGRRALSDTPGARPARKWADAPPAISGGCRRSGMVGGAGPGRLACVGRTPGGRRAEARWGAVGRTHSGAVRGINDRKMCSCTVAL